MKQFRLAALAAVLGILLSPAMAQALDLNYYEVENFIQEGGTVRNTVTFKFGSPTNHMDYHLNFLVYNLTPTGNFDSDCRIVSADGESTIVCDFAGMTEKNNMLTLHFDTEGNVIRAEGGFRFEANYGVPLQIGRAFMKVKLPEQSVLLKEPANASYFPSDGSTITDGRHIMVYWERMNLTAGESLQYSVQYSLGEENGVDYMFYLAAVLIVMGIVGVIIIGIVYVRRGPSSKEVIASVLNSEEKAIVDILNRNEGKSQQKALARQTDFSKAKVSRLVKSLKDRGVVEINPISGRENMIVLKKVKKE